MPRATRRGGVAVLVLVAGVCLVLAGLARDARAQQPQLSPQYTKAYNDGVTAYNNGIIKGDFTKAKKLFEKAIAFDDRWPGPYRYLALIGQAEKEYQVCLDNAFIAVKKNPDGAQAPATRTLHADCRDAMNLPAFRGQFGDGGAIHVSTGKQTGAKVKLNGLTMGATPFMRGFAAGTVEVEVELQGYLPAKKEAEILMGLVTDVIFELERDPNAEPAGTGNGEPVEQTEEGWVVFDTRPKDATVTWAGGEPPRGPDGRITAKHGIYEVEISAPNHEPWRRRVKVNKGQARRIDVVLRPTAERQSLRKKGYIFLGVASALAASGAAFGLLEMSKREEAFDIWETETARPVGADSSGFVPEHTRDDLESAVDKAKTYRLISAVSFGAAAAALGASIYYFIQERPVEREGFKLPLAVSPTSGDGGLGAQVTYTTRFDW